MPKPYTPNDKWSQKAAREGYRARSVYKLMELDERFRLLHQGMIVLDLGAAPGSWLQYTSEKIGPSGKAIGFDLTAIHEVAPNVSVYRKDITDLKVVDECLEQEEINFVDLVLSDIAPSTSGVKDVDQWKSIELAQSVQAVAERHLKPGGRCVIKIFRGSDFDRFLQDTKRTWKNVRMVKVAVSRDRSREVYLVMTR